MGEGKGLWHFSQQTTLVSHTLGNINAFNPYYSAFDRWKSLNLFFNVPFVCLVESYCALKQGSTKKFYIFQYIVSNKEVTLRSLLKNIGIFMVKVILIKINSMQMFFAFPFFSPPPPFPRAKGENCNVFFAI